MSTITPATAETVAAETIGADPLALRSPVVENPGFPSAPSAALGESSEAHVLDLLIVLSQRRRIVLGTTVAAAVLTAALQPAIMPAASEADSRVAPGFTARPSAALQKAAMAAASAASKLVP